MIRLKEKGQGLAEYAFILVLVVVVVVALVVLLGGITENMYESIIQNV